MKNVQDIFKKAFEGLNLTKEQQDLILSIYLISTYKNMLEILITLKNKEPQFINSILDVMNKAIESLDEEKKKIFNQIMAEENANTVTKIIETFSNNLTDDLKVKLEENLKKIIL